MRKTCLVLLVVVSTVVASLQTQAADDPLVGRKVEQFKLVDFHGREHTLAQYSDKQAIVMAFLGTQCPLARLYAPRLAELAREYAGRGIVILGVDSNKQDTPTELAAMAEQMKLEFPLLKDNGNVLADQLGATRTPEIFVLDRARVVRYHGRVDDQFGISGHRDKANQRELAAALEELLAGKEVAQSTSPFYGCLISKAKQVEPHGDVTYAKDVAAIMNRRCVECHREGELAPFVLSDYKSVLNWADSIREVVAENRMPPWFADPRFGRFSNDCSMTPEEKQTIFTWVENGCPEGNKTDLPNPPVFTTGWRMGPPDQTFEMTAAFQVPSEGTVPYQYFTLDREPSEDLWITAAEGRPGNPSIVHHIVLFSVPPGRKMRTLEDAQAVGQMVCVYAPGMNPWVYPEGSALKVEKGSKFVIQMHYTPNGTAQTDLSYVGLKLAKAEDVKKQVRYSMAVNSNFVIPPGADNHEVTSKASFSKDTLILGLFPHMHYRGKSFKFEAEYADGTRETILDVPRYDFSWQLRYDFEQPKLMPAGSKLLCTAHFDNSEANIYNPDPTKPVRFGLQTWEEMMVGYYTHMPAGE